MQYSKRHKAFASLKSLVQKLILRETSQVDSTVSVQKKLFYYMQQLKS